MDTKLPFYWCFDKLTIDGAGVAFWWAVISSTFFLYMNFAMIINFLFILQNFIYLQILHRIFSIKSSLSNRLGILFEIFKCVVTKKFNLIFEVSRYKYDPLQLSILEMDLWKLLLISLIKSNFRNSNDSLSCDCFNWYF